MAKTSKNNKPRNYWIVTAVVVVAILAVVGGVFCFNILMNPSRITVAENQTNIEVKKGQEFSIRLSSNATTGYAWSVDGTYDKNVVGEVSNAYIAPNTDLVGAGGTEVWVFKGVNTGSTKLTLKYSRSWEQNVAPVNTVTYDVTVK